MYIYRFTVKICRLIEWYWRCVVFSCSKFHCLTWGKRRRKKKKGLCSDQYRCSQKLSIWPEILLDGVSINQTPLTLHMAWWWKLFAYPPHYFSLWPWPCVKVRPFSVHKLRVDRLRCLASEQVWYIEFRVCRIVQCEMMRLSMRHSFFKNFYMYSTGVFMTYFLPQWKFKCWLFLQTLFELDCETPVTVNSCWPLQTHTSFIDLDLKQKVSLMVSLWKTNKRLNKYIYIYIKCPLLWQNTTCKFPG